jgi:hypothetical protein
MTNKDDCGSNSLAGLAVCHCGAGSEAGSNICYIKFGIAIPSDGSSQQENFKSWINCRYCSSGNLG